MLTGWVTHREIDRLEVDIGRGSKNSKAQQCNKQLQTNSVENMEDRGGGWWGEETDEAIVRTEFSGSG